MQDKQFDEFFRDRISGYGSPVPVDMWDKVKPPQAPKKRRMIWFWIFVAGLGLSGGIYLYNSKTSNINSTAIINSSSITKEKSIIKETDADLRRQKDKPDTSSIFSSDSSLKRIVSHPGVPATYKPDKLGTMKTISRKFSKRINIELATITSEDHADRYDTAKSLPKFKPSIQGPIDIISENGDTDTVHKAVSPMKPELERQPGNGWFAEFYAGPAVGIKSVEKATPFPLIENATSKISYSSGVYIGKFVGKHFLVKTGLAFTSINEKSSRDSMSVSRKAIRYTSFDLPVILGYSTGNSAFTFNLNAGLMFNIHSSYAGTIIDSLGMVDVNSSGYFRKRTGARGYAGVRTMYSINKKIQLYGEPYFLHQFSNMSARKDYFSQKMHVVGILVGMRYSIPSRQQN